MSNLLGIENIKIFPRSYFIISDLHLEFRQENERLFWENFPEQEETKVCIVAGDVTNIGRPYDTRHFEGLCKRFRKVLYVPGNHEYYGSNPTDVSNRLKKLEAYLNPTLKILRAGEPFTYQGQRFIGDTMWFPDKPEVHIYRGMINDYSQIKGLFPWAFTQSNLFLVYLRENVQEDDIVITHHVPNDVDTQIHWKTSQTQSYFLNADSNRYCMNPNSVMPKAWIYGHTHDKHDYHIGRTRFICNPLGYPSDRSFCLEEASIYKI